MQINLVGANKYPVFEVRLGEVLTGLMNLSDLELTPQNYQILHGASLEVWHHALSSITLDETKLLKSADEAPSPEQILATLPIVDGEWRPGTYVELITPGPGALSLGDAKVFFYSGSGSGVGLGIAMRCGQHGSAAHRAHEYVAQFCLLPRHCTDSRAGRAKRLPFITSSSTKKVVTVSNTSAKRP